MSMRMAKSTEWPVRPAKTQISMGIRPVWSEPSLSAWKSFATYWAHSEDSGQTGRMPRLIWVFAGRTGYFVGFVVLRLKCILLSFDWRNIRVLRLKPVAQLQIIDQMNQWNL